MDNNMNRENLESIRGGVGSQIYTTFCVNLLTVSFEVVKLS